MHYDSSHEDSTPLHIHDCDVKDDVELTAIVYADEIPTGLADETVIASAPRVPTQEQVAEKYHRPDRYVKHDDLLEWDPKNTIPDVFAMTEQHTMHAKIWIPIFTGKKLQRFHQQVRRPARSPTLEQTDVTSVSFAFDTEAGFTSDRTHRPVDLRSNGGVSDRKIHPSITTTCRYRPSDGTRAWKSRVTSEASSTHQQNTCRRTAGS